MARKGRNAPRKGKMMEKKDAVSSMRPKARPSSKLAPRASMRPKARPNDTTMETSLRPRARPNDMPTVDEIGAIERGNRAAKRTAADLAMLASPGPASAGAAAGKAAKKAMGMKYGGKVKKMKKGGKMPDLTGDGKVTQADVLKGRGVFKKGGKVRGYGLARGGKVCKMR